MSSSQLRQHYRSKDKYANGTQTKQNERREQKIDQSQESETNEPNSNHKEANNSSQTATVKHVNESENYTD